MSDLMRSLAQNAHGGQWHLDRDLPWERGAALPRWIPHGPYVRAIAHLLAGELATVEACRRVLRLDDGAMCVEARACLRLQIADETRHAAAYARYLELIGASPDRNRDDALVRILAAANDGAPGFENDPRPTVLAFHVLLETAGLAIQKYFVEHAPCPLLREINRRVMRDEARHIAFGDYLLRAGLSDIEPAGRARLYDWLRELWQRTGDHAERRHRLLFWIAGNRARREVASCWEDVERRLAGIGLSRDAEWVERAA